MARSPSWSDVRGGLVACLVIAVVAFGILRYMRVGALHGDTFRLYALVGEARGVMTGSEVWLSGQKIGKITGIRFRSPTQMDTTARIEIAMELLEEHRPALRRDAVAQVRSGGSIIGPPVVYLSPGSVRGAPIQPGDTVHMLVQSDFQEATAQFGAATAEVPAIMSNVKALGAKLQSTDGTVGAMLNGPGMAGLEQTRAQASRLMTTLGSGRGTIGPILRGGLSTRAGRVMSRVDSVRALLASPATSIGRFRKDSTLMAEVGDIRDELTLVRAALERPDGTVGRLQRDSAMTIALGQARDEMTLLLADIKKNPRRYLSFSF
jgi:phospholipid/cholesterol/gamma-HCH transport system substrate-binding protein